MNGSLWGETPHGLWVPMRDLGAAHPSTFHGELVNDGATVVQAAKDDDTVAFAKERLQALASSIPAPPPPDPNATPKKKKTKE